VIKHKLATNSLPDIDTRRPYFIFQIIPLTQSVLSALGKWDEKKCLIVIKTSSEIKISLSVYSEKYG
jgi:hypothetical protein